ncbi:MAG: L-ribulose-5-phosphate 4-epimerase AraD [Spirochaetota bacterium]
MIKRRLKELMEDVYVANMKLVDSGLVIHTFGNVSGIDREEGIIAIKPSGVEYADLSVEDMVLVDMQGKVVEGELTPSSDTSTHLKLYQAFPEIGGVVHTHSRYATAWAQAMKPIPCLGTTHADYFHGEIPCTGIISDGRIKKDYEQETGVQIIERFKNINHRSMKAVLVACHGPFTWGRDAEDAVFTSVMLEEIAMTAYMSVLLNPELENIKQSLLDKHFLRKHGKNAYYGQKQESLTKRLHRRRKDHPT